MDPLPEGVLPVIDPDELAGAAAAHRELAQPLPPRRRRREPKGNTKLTLASERRREVTADAVGKLPKEPDGEDWRADLAGGRRGRAGAELAGGGVTHNASSGVGCRPPFLD